jgi:hypothetical protein
MRFLIIVLSVAFVGCAHRLPNENISIHGGAEIGGWPDGIVQTCWGAKQRMRAGERELGLIHLLILPPSGERLVTTSSGSDSTSDPNVVWYEWMFPHDRTVRFAISYYPDGHVVSVQGRRYRLSKGNLFFADVRATDHIEFTQLHRTLFQSLKPEEALQVFLKELPLNERVQKGIARLYSDYMQKPKRGYTPAQPTR